MASQFINLSSESSNRLIRCIDSSTEELRMCLTGALIEVLGCASSSTWEFVVLEAGDRAKWSAARVRALLDCDRAWLEDLTLELFELKTLENQNQDDVNIPDQ